MKNFLRDHPEALLVFLAIVFLAIIIGFYFWGVNDIVVTVNKALNYVPSQQNAEFNLDAAAKLDLRGLVN